MGGYGAAGGCRVSGGDVDGCRCDGDGWVNGRRDDAAMRVGRAGVAGDEMS